MTSRGPSGTDHRPGSSPDASLLPSKAKRDLPEAKPGRRPEPRPKISVVEKTVLAALVAMSHDYPTYFWNFDAVRRESGIDNRKAIRIACRSLRRKGLAAFSAGLWSENGDPAGAGYAATAAGRELLETRS